MVRIFSSKPKPVAPPPPPLLQQEAGLLKRLAALWCTEGEVSNAIDECIKEGKTVTKIELERCIKEFRRFKRHRHALEVRCAHFAYDFGVRIHRDLVEFL